MTKCGKWYIHVNQHKIRSNINASPENIQAPITIKRGRSGRSTSGNNVRIPDGSHIIYSPYSPLLACGARVVIECPSEPTILE